MKTPINKFLTIINEHADGYIGKEELRVKKAYRDIACCVQDFKLLELEKQFVIDFANKLLEMPNRFLEAKTVEEHLEDFISNGNES